MFMHHKKLSFQYVHSIRIRITLHGLNNRADWTGHNFQRIVNISQA